MKPKATTGYSTDADLIRVGVEAPRATISDVNIVGELTALASDEQIVRSVPDISSNPTWWKRLLRRLKRAEW